MTHDFLNTDPSKPSCNKSLSTLYYLCHILLYNYSSATLTILIRFI
jgi:hypothetical protein